MSSRNSSSSSSSTYLSQLSPPVVQQLERVLIDSGADSDDDINVGDVNISSNPGDQETNIMNRIEKLETLLHKLLMENRALKDKLLKNEHDKYDIWNRLHGCETDINLLNQYSRRENIEIAGIPQNIKNEDLERYVIDTLRNIGVSGLSSYEITACHRLKTSRSSNRPANVIVRFVNRKRAYESLDKFHFVKTKFPNDFKNFMIFENLCPTFRRIFNKSRKLKFMKKIKNVWSYEGLVFLQKTDNSVPIKICHLDELEELYPEVFE